MHAAQTGPDYKLTNRGWAKCTTLVAKEVMVNLAPLGKNAPEPLRQKAIDASAAVLDLLVIAKQIELGIPPDGKTTGQT